MSEKLTQAELLADDDFMNTLRDYSYDRYEKSGSDEELLETFLEDYRSLNNNTVGASRFITYASSLLDEDYKDNLAKAYNKVDQELEDFYADESTTFAQKTGAALDYLYYNVVDPINLLGFGAGKLVAMNAARPLIRKAIQASLSSPALVGAGAGAVTSGVASGAVDIAAQEAEKSIGARDEIDLKRTALTGVIGGVTGGAFGALGGREVAKRTKGILDSVATPQDIASKQGLENIEVPDTGYIGYYVTSKGLDEVKDSVTDVGRVIGQEGKTLQVIYSKYNDATGLVEDGPVKRISVDKLKAVSEDAKRSYLSKRDANSLLPLDPTKVNEGKERLVEIFGSREEAELFSARLNEEVFTRLRAGIDDVVAKNPTLKDIYNEEDRVTTRVVKILEAIDGSKEFDYSNAVKSPIMQDFLRSLGSQGILPEDFSRILLAEASTMGRNFRQLAELKKILGPNHKNKLQQFGMELRKHNESLDSESREVQTYLNEVNKNQRDFNFGSAIVDLFRGVIVTGIPTTVRNILGSSQKIAAQEGVKFLNAPIDLMFDVIEARMLGRPINKNVIERLQSKYGSVQSAKETFQSSLLGRLSQPADAIMLSQYLAKNFREIDRKIFRALEDFDDAFGSSVKNPTRAQSVVLNLGKGVRGLNYFNAKQDRAFKSAGFLASLDEQIERKIKFGIDGFTDKNLDTIEKIIKAKRVDLLNDQMIKKALRDAYTLTFQERDAGAEVELVGGLITKTQELLNNTTVLKVPFPFPNFMASSVAFFYNRLPGTSFLKPLIRSGKLIGKAATGKGGKAKRQRLEQLELEITKVKKSISRIKKPKNREKRISDLKKLTEERNSLSSEFGGIAEDARKLRDGIRENVEGLAFLMSAYSLRTMEGQEGTRWYEFRREDGTILDLRPLFPIVPFLYVAEVLKRYNTLGLEKEKTTMAEFDFPEGIPALPEILSPELLEAVTGTNVRSGIIGKVLKANRNNLQSDNPDDQNRLAQSIGEIVGYLASSVTIPGKLFPEMYASFSSDPETRRKADLRLRFTVKADDNWFMNAWNGLVSEFTRGFVKGESEAFGKRIPTQAKTTTANPYYTEAAPTRASPIEKYTQGTFVSGRRDPMESALIEHDIDPFKTRIYTSIAEYDNIVNRALGDIADQNLSAVLGNNFRELPFEARQQRLLDFYTDAKKTARAAVKQSYPILTSLVNLRKKGYKKISKAVKALNRPEIDLQYYDEKNPDNEAKNAELRDLVSQLNAQIAFMEKKEKIQFPRLTGGQAEKSVRERLDKNLNPTLEVFKRNLPTTPDLKNEGGIISKKNLEFLKNYHDTVVREGRERYEGDDTGPESVTTIRIVGLGIDDNEYILPSYDPDTKQIMDAKEVVAKFFPAILDGQIEGYKSKEEAKEDREKIYKSILGFSEGGNIGRKGMSVLGHMADPNYPMTTAEVESGKRSITDGRVLRAVPIAEYGTEAVKEMASGRNPTKAAEVAADLGRDKLTNRIKTFVKEMYDEPTRASKIAKEKFDFKQDNPAVWNADEGLKWLKSNQAYTLEKSGNKTLTGPISKQTAFLGTNVDMFLPTKMLKSMKGAAGERRFRGDSGYDHLKKQIGDDFDIDQKGNKVVVAVNQNGEGFVYEGNTRTAVADKLKIPYLRAEVRYLNGGELVDGPFSVKNLVKVAKTRKGAEKSIEFEKEYGDYIKENLNTRTKPYQNIEEVMDEFKQFKTGGLMRRM